MQKVNGNCMATRDVVNRMSFDSKFDEHDYVGEQTYYDKFH